MPWTVNKLSVDLNQDLATVELDSNGTPNTSVSLSFAVPENGNKNDRAQILGGVTRQAVLAQAKQILGDAASSL